MLKRYVKTLKKYFYLNPWIVVTRIILMLCDVFSGAFNLIFPKLLINYVRNSNFVNVYKIIFIFFTINIFKIFLNRISYIYISNSQEKINISLFHEFLVTASKHKYKNIYHKEYMDHYFLSFDNVINIHSNSVDIFINCIEIIVSILLATGIVYYIDSNILLFILIFASINFLFSKYKNNISYEINKATIKVTRKLKYIYNFFIYNSYIRDTKINSFWNFICKQKDFYSNEFLYTLKKNDRKKSNLNMISSFLDQIENVIIFIYFTFILVKNLIQIEDFFVIINSYNYLRNNISSLLGVYSRIHSNDIYLRSYEMFNINYEKDVRNSIDIINQINLCGVAFSYSDNKDLLKNINITLKLGDKLYIKGKNGSGKSTLIKLISGFEVPNKGCIFFNGDRKISTLEYNPINAISILFQNNNLYPFSILDNICISNNLKEKDIDYLTEKIFGEKSQINYKDFITTNFCDRGVELSGGEAQLIFLLRTLINESSVLILDEPFNHLDNNTSQILLDYLNSIEGKIIILISHTEANKFKYNKFLEL